MHEALRTLGFAADDIYVSSGRSVAHPFNPPALFVILKTQDKEFVVTVGVYESESAVDKALVQWTEFATLLNEKAFDEKRLEEIFHSSNLGRSKTQFVASLFSKGFRPPNRMN